MNCRQCRHFFASGKNSYCGYYHEKSDVIIVPAPADAKCRYFNQRDDMTSKFQAMHRRAQKAESRAAKAERALCKSRKILARIQVLIGNPHHDYKEN